MNLTTMMSNNCVPATFLCITWFYYHDILLGSFHTFSPWDSDGISDTPSKVKQPEEELRFKPIIFLLCLYNICWLIYSNFIYV